MNSRKKRVNRRDFLLSTASTAAAFTIVPRHVLAGSGRTPPSEKLNIAGVGVGGMGKSNLKNLSDENIVAICDVDEKYAGKVFDEYPQAKKYTDFRKMLEKQKDIDAVVVATPDHTHAVVSMMAMKMGKHVYCQKPLTHSVYEARKLTEAAREYKVATQMGNQGHSGEGVRLICEWIWDGAIGEVREVHAWTNRPVWPQGIDRPKESPPVPATLDWDLWLGPAPYRPYHPSYLPFNWRAWWDFGTGALGDMACHVLDPVFWALKLGYPTAVEACHSYEVREMWKRVDNKETYPSASMVRYEFPARENMPPVKLRWYDGGMLPPRPEELERGRKTGKEGSGVIFVGDKGKLMCGTYGDSPRLIPETRMREYKRPPKRLPRIEGDVGGHEKNWVRACKGGEPACSNFDHAGFLTEAVLMGNLAIRNPGERLNWDGPNMTVTNVAKANEYVRRQYREGWTL
ncbi:MAG: Gfo/Idh/MocA family protein [Planctomycetota bacterium]|jgi:predicted dehydrogenase